jgi:cytochrome c-type biogenesis protein CcmH
MKTIKISLVSLVFLLIFPGVFAEVADRYPFSSSQQQQQFENLISQLRCLVCQNQNLADSNADLAKDLRQQVYNLILAHQSDEQIKSYMTERYGDYILFKPPFSLKTLVLWLGPFFLLILAFSILWRLTRSGIE